MEIAQVIRSGESADTVQADFDLGARQYEGKLAKPRGEVSKITSDIESYLMKMEAVTEFNEDNVEEYLNKNEDIKSKVDVTIPFNPGNDTIKLTSKIDPSRSESFDTSDIEGILDFISKVDAQEKAKEKAKAKAKEKAKAKAKEKPEGETKTETGKPNMG